MTFTWIPNVLTLGNLILGFTAMILASGESPYGRTAPSILILGAALLDGLDGTVARALKVAAPLGKELDSLADCVTFGVAPAYLAHRFYLAGMVATVMGQRMDLGIVFASVFPACAAYRLARFNVLASAESFEGLPSPVAGALVALFPLCFRTLPFPEPLFAAVLCLLAFLMVSTIRYAKPQARLFRRIHGTKLGILLALLAVTFFFFKFWMIFMFIGLYILSGILSLVIQFMQDRRY
jgi:CDP-diacylglycerol--serine O-phosphatidyltransferase